MYINIFRVLNILTYQLEYTPIVHRYKTLRK